MEGSLSKWTNLMKGWQFRWCSLDENAGILSYYLSKEKMKKGERRGCISLKRAVVGIDNEDDSTFTVTSHMKTYHFQAADLLERDRWVRHLEDAILRHAYGSRNRKTLAFAEISKTQPTMEDFGKKLSEADAYLQLVIDQTQTVNRKMETLTKFEDQARCSIISTYANDMMDNVKHTIVLLQIAKNMMRPENASSPVMRNDVEQMKRESLQPPVNVDVDAQSVGSIKTTGSTKHTNTSDEERYFDAEEYMIESKTAGPSSLFDLEKFCWSTMSEKVVGLKEGIVFDEEQGEGLDEVDEDEDEDEDEDVIEEDQAHLPDEDLSGCLAAGSESVDPSSVLISEHNHHPSSSVSLDESVSTRPPFLNADGSLKYDYFYEVQEEFEPKVECSVVTHLISQVKIGMDLSKVVLPIFILEKRSLLEMYADFFAHPDVFVRIAGGADAKSRMIRVVKWYLTAFHAGRQVKIAKKPYNPILGEVFLCHWDLGALGGSDSGEVSSVLDGGPVNWCDGNQLAFGAEQVSHHPPISAFYAECPNKKISCTSYVWTKSKFLGLSVGVINDGKAVVDVIDHNEQYEMTFPNAYGRSILTKPWFELAGTIQIVCKQTGFSSKIEFLPKPFYGTKKHKIVGAISEPGSSKPFVVLDGEWTGRIHARWMDGTDDIFADVIEMPTLKKVVRPVNEQEYFESRYIWKDVTAGLWLNDIARATNSKMEIESRQRQEAQERMEHNVKWETKLFEATATGDWVYKTPLTNRVKRAH